MCIGDESYSYGGGMLMPGSPIEMPGSPSSDCSASTASLDFVSPPVSPFPNEDSCSSFSSTSTASSWTRNARPAKSSLRRVGAAPRQRRVTWDPATVFETAPLISKRRRAAAAAEALDDEEMLAPTPTKRTKLAEPLESQASATFRPHITATTNSHVSSMQLSAELAGSVVPCFDFSSCLAITMTKQTFGASTAPVVAFAAAPTAINFSIAKPKTFATSKLLSKA